MRFNAGKVARGVLVYLTIMAVLYGTKDLFAPGPATIEAYTAARTAGDAYGTEYAGARAPFVGLPARRPDGGWEQAP